MKKPKITQEKPKYDFIKLKEALVKLNNHHLYLINVLNDLNKKNKQLVSDMEYVKSYINKLQQLDKERLQKIAEQKIKDEENKLWFNFF